MRFERIGRYSVTAKIGAGGMGEVYKATDTRLDRTVAIKVLPEHVASDPDLKQRFEREAKTISSLNHPHICTLHDIGSQDGIDFLVMEYLEGETLAQRLEKGALPLDQALQIAIEIADALGKAHRQGIVHRDLKPGNIVLTKSGAKLLDFGLAKLRRPGTVGAEGFSAAATRSEPLTGKGMLLGTVQYMAPEQPRPLSAWQPRSSAALDHVVAKCLSQQPEHRWYSTHDLCNELEWAGKAANDRPGGQSGGSATPRWLVAAGAGALVATGVTAVVMSSSTRHPEPSQVVRSTISRPRGMRNVPAGIQPDVAISPDGTHVAYRAVDEAGRGTLLVQPIDRFDAMTVQDAPPDATNPVFSPDGRWVAFFAPPDRLMKVPLAGGPPVTVCDCAAERGIAWGLDDTILFAGRGSGSVRLWRVSAVGDAPEPITSPEDGALTYWPEMLPDGDTVLFTYRDDPNSTGRITALSLRSGDTRDRGHAATLRATCRAAISPLRTAARCWRRRSISTGSRSRDHRSRSWKA